MKQNRNNGAHSQAARRIPNNTSQRWQHRGLANKKSTLPTNGAQSPQPIQPAPLPLEKGAPIIQCRITNELASSTLPEYRKRKQEDIEDHSDFLPLHTGNTVWPVRARQEQKFEEIPKPRESYSHEETGSDLEEDEEELLAQFALFKQLQKRSQKARSTSTQVARDQEETHRVTGTIYTPNNNLHTRKVVAPARLERRAVGQAGRLTRLGMNLAVDKQSRNL